MSTFKFICCLPLQKKSSYVVSWKNAFSYANSVFGLGNLKEREARMREGSIFCNLDMECGRGKKELQAVSFLIELNKSFHYR